MRFIPQIFSELTFLDKHFFIGFNLFMIPSLDQIFFALVRSDCFSQRLKLRKPSLLAAFALSMLQWLSSVNKTRLAKAVLLMLICSCICVVQSTNMS